MEDIVDIAKARYPIQTVRDIDGDYYDANKNERQSFGIGMMTAFKLSKTFTK